MRASSGVFFWGAARLLVVADTAGSDEVLPGVTPATVARHHVVDREVARLLAAVLAHVVIAHEDLAPGEAHLRSRPLDHVDEANHGGAAEVLHR
jgi:hypothetical protein